jgi:hypothetical protein
MAERGRPPKGVERSNILLRMPTDLIEQVDTFKESLEAERGGFVINRTDMLIRLIEVGLQTLTQARQPATPPGPASPVNGQGAPAEPVPERAHVDHTVAQEKGAQPRGRRSGSKTPARHGLPREKLQEIADERTQCEGLSLREFAQRLHDRGIYSSRAKDGSPVPANPGNLKKWLDQARHAGVL